MMDSSLPETVSPGSEEHRDIDENKDIAAFSYLWVMSVVVYLLKKKSPFVRHHSKQAMVLFVLSILVWFIPFINRLLELILLGLMAYGFLGAAQGLKRDVPIVGPLSRGEMSVRDAWKELTTVVVRFAKAMKDLAKDSKPSKTAPPPSPETPSSSPPPQP